MTGVRFKRVLQDWAASCLSTYRLQLVLIVTRQPLRHTGCVSRHERAKNKDISSLQMVLLCKMKQTFLDLSSYFGQKSKQSSFDCLPICHWPGDCVAGLLPVTREPETADILIEHIAAQTKLGCWYSRKEESEVCVSNYRGPLDCGFETVPPHLCPAPQLLSIQGQLRYGLSLRSSG